MKKKIYGWWFEARSFRNHCAPSHQILAKSAPQVACFFTTFGLLVENEIFCVKRGLNADHFSNLVRMQTLTQALHCASLEEECPMLEN